VINTPVVQMPVMLSTTSEMHPAQTSTLEACEKPGLAKIATARSSAATALRRDPIVASIAMHE